MHTETSAVWDPSWKGAPLFDPATNLRSGAAVMDALRRELSRAARFCPDVAVVALALRPAGLEARDEMLRRAGCICARSVRDYDPIGRIGPAELLLVFPDCRLDEGHRIATRLKTNIVSSMGLASVWAGVSATGAGVSDALELVQAALSNLGVARLSETAALGQPSSWSLAPRVSDRSVGAS